jgi:hypothetical protein
MVTTHPGPTSRNGPTATSPHGMTLSAKKAFLPNVTKELIQRISRLMPITRNDFQNRQPTLNVQEKIDKK